MNIKLRPWEQRYGHDIINLFLARRRRHGGPYEIGRIYRYVNEGRLEEPSK